MTIKHKKPFNQQTHVMKNESSQKASEYDQDMPQSEINDQPGTEVMKLFSCSTQLSTNFQVLIKIKYRQMKKFLPLNLSDVVFIMLINVKMPTIEQDKLCAQLS